MNDAINSFYKCVSNNLLGSERNKFRNVCYYLLEKYYVSHVCAFNLNELIDYFKDFFIVLQFFNYCAIKKVIYIILILQYIQNRKIPKFFF